MEITDKFEINKTGKLMDFSIRHKEIPIKLSPDLDEAIKMLLWYVPNITSEQAKENELLLNPEYDDYIFKDIMASMKLEDRDVLFAEEISEKLAKKFEGKVGVDEQKLIMTLADSSETKTMALLRHIRNAIAHGNFNVINDLVIGFDIKRFGEITEYRAVFKINPTNLLKALRKINLDFTTEEFIAKAFRKSGYRVEPFQEEFERSHRFDLYAKKKDKRFAIEIKNYDYEKNLKEDFVKEMIGNISDMDTRLRPILIINSSYLTENSKDDLIKNDVIILDIKNIKKMQKGRDMISEILREQEVYKKCR